jgi:hypothetical protein
MNRPYIPGLTRHLFSVNCIGDDYEYSCAAAEV